jgi:UDP-3-O-[3-hydroxymyristoyl] N-acetylglucosamine deacetylase
MRLTLKDEICFSGVGLHSGKQVSLRLLPAESGEGYGFVFDEKRWPIQKAGHTGDGRGTILSFGPHRIMTIEHVLASLCGLGIDDVTIVPDGEEAPLMDGSSRDFCAEILKTGFVKQGGDPTVVQISSPIFVVSPDEQKVCIALPSDKLRFTYSVDYGDNAISSQLATVTVDPVSFVTELAECRTFCLYEEIEQMRAMGLALGGTVETALIVKGPDVLTPGGLRRPDEFVRHKILDMLGDLALIGKKVVGHFIAVRAGHALHQKLVDQIMFQYR